MIYAISMFSFLAAAAQSVYAPLESGQWPLSELGYYRVGYQSYGAEPVHLPPAWTGHFDATSGISYVPSEYVQGRDAMLLHSPWHVPPGKTWVDYTLRLPVTTPIALHFGITMRADIAVPDKSDGATFGCVVIDDTGKHELLREHYAKGEWKDLKFDLAPFAGKDITLRLQIEPGPNNSPSWDYSYFSAPTIAVGDGKRPAVDVDALLKSKASMATAEASLVAASNNPVNGIIPSNLLPCVNETERVGEAFRFSYDGNDCRIEYTYVPSSGTLDDFSVTIDSGVAIQPALGGGVTAVARKDGKDIFTPLRGGTLRSAELDDHAKTLAVVWAYPFAESTVEVRWKFGIRGKALTVDVECAEPVLSGLSLGRVGNVPFRKIFGVPYLLGSVEFLSSQHVYACRYLDWTASHASMCPQGDATYGAKTDGTRNPLYESGYIAVSPNVIETLPNLPSPPSPYLAQLGPRIMLDVWQHHDGTYQGDAKNLRELKDNGVDHLAIISHVWQRYGYDVKLPDHIPADPRYGGDDGMKEFGKAANECGYIWSLHENYTDLYPDAPSYDPAARVIREDGTPSPGWFNAGTGVQAFGMKFTRSLGFAKQNSPEIHARFGTTAAYLDVHTCVPPWHQVDYDATQPMAAMAQLKLQRDTELFQYERDTHGGPLFGEGNQHFFWAGRCDGVEAQVSGGEDHVPLLDFDLLKIHPQMVNHGMGYYERWFRRGYDHQWGYDTGTPEQVDKYRAQEIAYGHAGFIGAAQTDNVQWVAKEHHMMHPIQRLANTAKVTRIVYEVDGRFAPISVALAANQRMRQQITYDSGLTVWVNWDQEPWTVEGRVLPQWGVLAIGPDTRVETTLRDGQFADYAECPEYVFVDARTSFYMPYRNVRKDITPRVHAWEALGGNRVRLTYAWSVNDTVADDCIAFVHFLDRNAPKEKEIAFQQDHGTPTPTSQWKVGDTVIDGPYDIAVPEQGVAEYDIAVGLYKGARVPLKGAGAEGFRVIIGTLRVERDGGVITKISITDTDVKPAAGDPLLADFSAHMNPAETSVDFGAVTTDGSVKVERRDGELIVFPYPRNKAFTVALDIARLTGAPLAASANVRVTALAAGTQHELGEVACRFDGGRVAFTTGVSNAGRYRVRW